MVADRGAAFSATISRGVSAVQMPRTSRARCPARRFAAVGCLAIAALVGCQSARTPTTVAPPATGMIGQPAQYGSWATMPQGAAYPASPSPPPMPGPVTQWQGTAPAAPAANSWSWAQPAQQVPAPTLQQYAPAGSPAAGYPQNLANQAQQYGNQLQGQTQQYANQMQQQAQASANQLQQGVNNQWQQMTNQAQQQAQQAMTGAQQQAQQYMNGAQQQAQQYLNGAQQQVTAQMPQYQPPPQYQAAPNTSWNPFATSATSLPPARATPPPPSAVPRY